MQKARSTLSESISRFQLSLSLDLSLKLEHGGSFQPSASRLRKTLWVGLNFIGLHILDNRITPRRMLKKAVRQGRSERRGEAYASVR
jgi:hypothetical protein